MYTVSVTKPRLLNESSTSLRTGKDGGQWKATLITPGKGSSGTYAESMLAEHAAKAFPAGTKMFFGHPKDGEGAGARDPRDQWGYLPEPAHYEEGVGVVGHPVVLPHAKEIVDSLGEQAALSVWVMGEADEQGNITALHADPTNSVDIVAYPGRPGSGLTDKMREALREAADSTKPGVTSAQDHQKKEAMDKEILEAITGLASEFRTFMTESKAAAEAKAKAEADANAAKDSVEKAVESYDKAVKAIADADLLPSQAESLREQAKQGVDITPLVESAKKVVAEARETLGNGSSISGRYTAADGDGNFELNFGGR